VRGLLQDLRFAVRMLAKAPGFTAIAVLTLGVNHVLGVSSAAFTSLLPLSEKREVGIRWCVTSSTTECSC
jgi:hypothetical protein